MTTLELVERVVAFRGREHFGLEEEDLYQFLWETSCSSKEDWDGKGCMTTNVSFLGDGEYYSTVGSRDSAGNFHGIEEGPERVYRKEKTIVTFSNRKE